MYKRNPASGILNELSDCILYRQTNGTLHRGRAALGQPTFNFTFYENPRNSLKKRDFPVTLQKCKKNKKMTFHSKDMCIIVHSKFALKSVFMGSKIFLDFRKIFKHQIKTYQN